MGITFLLRKEGLENIKKLDTMQINKIASYISEKLCNAFPDLHLSQSDLFIQISRLNMYTAKMQDNCTSAKYVYGNNSIFFNENLDLDKMDIPAIHECIHYMQETKDQKGKLVKLGLYDLNTQIGLALNEAATQLVASRTQSSQKENVTYYGLSLSTESPEYYPIECALINQMLFFTGKEALYFSTLYGTSTFEKAFTEASSSEVYNDIALSFDKLLNLETDLAILSQKFETEDSSELKLKSLRMQIEIQKKQIINIVEKTQNKILSSCFKKKLSHLCTLEEIKQFEQELEEYKKLLIISDNYTFYNKFCTKILIGINEKKGQIIKYGKVLNIPQPNSENLPILLTNNKLSKVQKIFRSLKEFIFGTQIAKKSDF